MRLFLLLLLSASSLAARPGRSASEAVEPVCGDGIVQGDEVCDDGIVDPVCPEGWGLCMRCVRCLGRVLTRSETSPEDMDGRPACVEVYSGEELQTTVSESTYDSRGHVLSQTERREGRIAEVVLEQTFDDQGRLLTTKGDDRILKTFVYTPDGKTLNVFEDRYGGRQLIRWARMDEGGRWSLQRAPTAEGLSETRYTMPPSAYAPSLQTDRDGDGTWEEKTELEWDSRGLLTRQRVWDRRDGEEHLVSETTWKHDRLGRVTTVTSRVDGRSASAALKYDSRGALSEMTLTPQGGPPAIHRFTYEGTDLVHQEMEMEGEVIRSVRTEWNGSDRINKETDQAMGDRTTVVSTSCLEDLKATAPDAISRRERGWTGP